MPRFPIPTIALALILGLLALPAHALPLGPVAYLESYDETPYPFTPDLDSIGAGGMAGLAIGNAAAPPTYDAPGVTVSLAGTAGPQPAEVAGTTFGPSAVGAGTFGARATFHSFSLGLTGDGRATTDIAAIFGTTSVTGTFAAQRIGGVEAYVLAVVETGAVGQTSVQVPLSAPHGAAILAGNAFALELLVDRVAGTAAALLNLDDGVGISTYTTSALPLAETSGVLTGAGQLATLANIDNVFGAPFDADDAMSVSFGAFVAHASVPEPGAALMMLVGLAGLAAQGRRTAAGRE